MKNDNDNVKMLFFLHLMLMIYSTSGIFSKKAAGVPFLSLPFCVYYGLVIVLLGFYAICWQQIIKRMPLTTAFANKAVTVVWGIVWGFFVFGEPVTPGKVIGALMVVAGIVSYSYADRDSRSRTGGDFERDGVIGADVDSAYADGNSVIRGVVDTSYADGDSVIRGVVDSSYADRDSVISEDADNSYTDGNSVISEDADSSYTDMKDGNHE